MTKKKMGRPRKFDAATQSNFTTYRLRPKYVKIIKDCYEAGLGDSYVDVIREALKEYQKNHQAELEQSEAAQQAPDHRQIFQEDPR